MITRSLLRDIRAELDAALAAIGKKHGLSITSGSCSFSDTAATFKVFVYLVPVVDASIIKDDANGDPWSLWDVLADIPREQWVFLHGTADSYHGTTKEGGAE